jgi:hypothetical protein
MAGANLLWHTRYDAETGEQFLVRECRECSNKRYRNKRSAVKRNQELELEARAAAAVDPLAQTA